MVALVEKVFFENEGCEVSWVRRGGGWRARLLCMMMLMTISAHKVGENLHHVGKVALHLYLTY